MQPQDAYRETAVGGSDGVRVVSLMFDGAVNFIRVARRRMESGDVAGKGTFLGKATSVVGELSASLNMQEGGEIARNLRRLYDFVLDRLLAANLRNDGKALAEAESVLCVLRDAWKDMERGLCSAGVPASRSTSGAATHLSV